MTEIYKSPIPCTGSKFKILPQILSLLPPSINTFHDLFCGSGVVGYNVVHRCSGVRLNDSSVKLIDLHSSMADKCFLKHVDFHNKYYDNTEEGYYRLRDDYNDEPRTPMLFNLICRSFNNQIRFNKHGEFNLPFGKRNRVDLSLLETHYKHISNHLPKFSLSRLDFPLWYNLGLFEKDDFLFCDPPYSNSIASYNTGWTETNDKLLYEMLDKAHSNGIRWMLTNVATNRGKDNPLFNEFRKKYTSIPTKSDFRQSSYRKSDKPTSEFIVLNY